MYYLYIYGHIYLLNILPTSLIWKPKITSFSKTEGQSTMISVSQHSERKSRFLPRAEHTSDCTALRWQPLGRQHVLLTTRMGKCRKWKALQIT